MSRFVYCCIWHPGRSVWVDNYLNVDRIDRAQLDAVHTDKTRIWFQGDGDGIGVLTEWDWATAATMLGVADMTQPTAGQAGATNAAMTVTGAASIPTPPPAETVATAPAPAPALAAGPPA